MLLLFSWNVNQRTTQRCQTTSLEPSKIEINAKDSTWGNIHFPGFSESWVKVSLNLGITEGNWALAVVRFPMEQGLSDSGKVRVISVPFLKTVIMRNEII